MAREMLSAQINYKPESHPESAYLKAHAHWDNRLGTVTAQASNWRAACFVALFLSLFLSTGIIYQASLNKVVPMVIAVDRESGEPKIIGKIREIGYEPRLAEIRYFLSQFVLKVRSVPADPVLIKRNWLESYKMMRQGAAQVLNEQVNNDPESPLKQIGKATVIAQIVSVTKVDMGDSYQVRWEEAHYDKGGQLKSRNLMNAVFTIEFETPSSEEILLINPLGIFIKSFQWSRELKGKI